MIYLNIDASELTDLLDMEEAVNDELKSAARALTLATHGKLIELAQERLHSRRQPYIDAVSMFQLDDTTFVVNLDASARWIEDGMCVVYARGKEPSVLTPDGWVKTCDVKIGMLVLNHLGKWTPVLAIHDNDLFDYCVEYVDEDATKLLCTKKKKYDHHAGTGERSKKPVVARCPSCNGTRITSRFAMTDGAGVSHCGKCLKKKPLVSFSIQKTGFFDKKLVLTADHRILSQRGWITAGELRKTDTVFVPAWGVCKSRMCENKVPFGGDFCSSKCGASESNNQELDEGRHVSQDPLWKAKFYKALGQKKVSNVEDMVARLISETTGQTVGFYGDGEFDWVRQFRVKSSVDRMGRQKYYFLDFYNPKLNLALEIDGHFHFTESGIARDAVRDKMLRANGIEPVHVPVALIKSGEFVKKILPALVANHNGDIELVPFKPYQLKRIIPTTYTPLHRRWDITVKDGSSYVCQGVVIHNSEHDMLENLLKSKKAKRAKDGSMYLSVPFQLNKPKNQQTPAQQSLLATVKKELAALGSEFPGGTVTPNKIEVKADGTPRLGLVRSLDITKAPISTQALRIGRGPMGQVAQGATGGIPILRGVRIYQKEFKDKAGDTKVGRFVMTFRTASSKQKGSGKWQHPGIDAVNLMDEAMTWALSTWSQKIAPSILAKITASLG